jgi:TPR repeat protein
MKKLIISVLILLFVYQINAQSKQQDTLNITLSPNSVALGDILKSLMPVMMFTANNHAELKQLVKEDTVMENVSALIRQGVRIESLRIINFKNSKTENFGGGFSQVTSGEFGKLVSVKDGKNGVTLIEYCEEINCLKIAKIFLDEISKINNSLLTSNKELSGLRLKAEKGDVNSQIELGNKFRDGVAPLEKDYLGAMKWYQMAADKGSATAQYLLAQIYFREKLAEDNFKAFELFLKSAQPGNSDALNMVGMCYSGGYGITKDNTEAVKWWLKASEAGDSNAQASLGYSYEYAQGVAQDYAEAIKWYTKSAEQGNVIASGSLGIIYFKGQGVPKDYNESVKWFTKGAEKGDETCRKNLEYVKSQIGK